MSAAVKRFGGAGRERATAEIVAAEACLPVPLVHLQAIMAAVYHAALAGAPRSELLEMICIQLAGKLNSPLVMLTRKVPNGSIAIEGASPDGELCLALHRVPERWDGGVASNGAASAALRANSPVRLSFDDEALALWKGAAIDDRVTEVLAWPMAICGDAYVMEIFGTRPMTSAANQAGVMIRSLAQALIALITDLDKIERQRLLSQALESAGNAAFVTDAHGTILWSNPAFSTLTGYAAEEVRGRNPKLLQSGHQGVRYYRDLWSTIRSGKVWNGETIDRDKDGNLYTIRQTVSPVAQDGRISHYVSIHEDVSAQKRRQQSLELATGTDARTGLLTRAAFEKAARDTMSTLSATQNGVEFMLVSLRGLRRTAASLDQDVKEFLAESMGRRVREMMPPPHLAAETAPFEYAILVSDDQLGGASLSQMVEDLRARLAEPVLYLGNSLDVDVHIARASYPADGDSFEKIWDKTDRQLADEPLARAHPQRQH